MFFTQSPEIYTQPTYDAPYAFAMPSAKIVLPKNFSELEKYLPLSVEESLSLKGNAKTRHILEQLKKIIASKNLPQKLTQSLAQFRISKLLNAEEFHLVKSDEFWRIINENDLWLQFAGLDFAPSSLRSGLRDFMQHDYVLEPALFRAWTRLLFIYENHLSIEAAYNSDDDKEQSACFSIFSNKRQKKNREKLVMQNLISSVIWGHAKAVKYDEFSLVMPETIGLSVDNYRAVIIDAEFAHFSRNHEEMRKLLAKASNTLEQQLEEIAKSLNYLFEKTASTWELSFLELNTVLINSRAQQNRSYKTVLERALDKVLPMHLWQHKEKLNSAQIQAYLIRGRTELSRLFLDLNSFLDKAPSLPLTKAYASELSTLHAQIIELLKLDFVQHFVPERLADEFKHEVSSAMLEKRMAELRGPLVGHYLTDTQLSLLTKIGINREIAVNLQHKIIWDNYDREILALSLIGVSEYWHPEMREYLAGLLITMYSPLHDCQWPADVDLDEKI